MYIHTQKGKYLDLPHKTIVLGCVTTEPLIMDTLRSKTPIVLGYVTTERGTIQTSDNGEANHR